MPQKKNPDVPELMRGKSGRVFGHLVGVADADEGAATGVQQGQSGRQGAGVRHRRHAAADAGDHGRSRRAGITVDAARMRRRQRDSRRRPTSPTIWSRRACRSATRTKPWRSPCATRRRADAIFRRYRWTSLQRFSPLIGDDVFAVAHARRLGGQPQSCGTDRAGAGTRGRAISATAVLDHTAVTSCRVGARDAPSDPIRPST